MKKTLLLILILFSCTLTSTTYAESSKPTAAMASSHNGVSMSIVTWGILLGLGIAALVFFIIPSSSSSAHSDD
ncbi:MAG: hypothetical protein HZB76_02080 [Chlamydiae bacterium]|nr:hypothetical protein [Chlamydiota bacterium]